MRRRLVILALPILVLARAASAQANGATDWFGRGITRVAENGTAVHLNLRVPAQGLLLRIVEHQPAEVLQVRAFPPGASVVRIPARVASERVTADQYGAADYASASSDPAHDQQVARQNQRNCEGPAGSVDPLTAATRKAECRMVSGPAVPAPRRVSLPRAPAREYLLLVLSDQPLDTADIARRLAAMPAPVPATAAHDVAEYLVGRRSPMWAGYLARR